MDFSLVICTRDRRDQLKACLAAVAQIRCQALWEIVIVDNGSTDGTNFIVQEFIRVSPVPVKAVFEKKPGLGRARNAGSSVAQGNIIGFTDDDCYPAPNFVDDMIVVFQDPCLGYVGGRILLHDKADFPITIQLKESAQLVPPLSFVPPGLIHGANFAVRRSALNSIGGFDDKLGAGTPFACGEDVDVLARLSANGWTGVYDPRPVVSHHHGRKEGPAVERLKKGYDIGRGAYYAKCLSDRRIRTTYLRAWWELARRQGKRRTAREILGALRYTLHL